MNRIHISTPASLPSAGDCTTIAANLDTWFQGNVIPLVSDAMEIRQIEVVSIAEQNGPQATFSSGYPIPGTINTPILPNNVALCVSLRSGLTGRSARGRWYWCGLTESQVAASAVDGGVVTSIVAAMDALISTIASLSSNVVIVSYESNGIPRPGGPVKFIVTDALAVDNTVDSQRRRLPGRGA